jgi:hypothetical protein
MAAGGNARCKLPALALPEAGRLKAIIDWIGLGQRAPGRSPRHGAQPAGGHGHQARAAEITGATQIVTGSGAAGRVLLQAPERQLDQHEHRRLRPDDPQHALYKDLMQAHRRPGALRSALQGPEGDPAAGPERAGQAARRGHPHAGNARCTDSVQSMASRVVEVTAAFEQARRAFADYVRAGHAHVSRPRRTPSRSRRAWTTLAAPGSRRSTASPPTA